MACPVSVIITAYNAQDYLEQCLDCMTQQTLRDIEIICVNDGSTDNTAEILNRYALHDDRIRVVHQQNSGAGTARNHGLQYATGQYVSILDADDFFELNMLEKAYRLAAENQADIAVFRCDLYREATGTFSPCGSSMYNELLPRQFPFSAADVARDVFKLFKGWAWDKLFLRSFIENNRLRFQEQRTTNDMLFVFSALLLAGRIVTSQAVLAHHREAVGTLSVTREKSWQCFYNALTALRGNMCRWGIFDHYEQDFVNYALHFSLWNLNTLQEPAHTLLYNKLRSEWFEVLGVKNHPESYFYHPEEYAQFKNICRYTAEEYARAAEKEKGKTKEKSLLLRGLCCLRDNGLRYTVQTMKNKMIGESSR